MYLVDKEFPFRTGHDQEITHPWSQPAAVDGGPWIWMEPRPLLDQTDDIFQMGSNRAFFF